MTLALNAAQQRLFDKHVSLIHRAVGRYGLKDPDEVAQEARLALANAAKHYDPARGVPFEAFAWHCIQNRCRTLLKKRPQPSSHDRVVGLKLDVHGTVIGKTLYDALQDKATRQELQSSRNGEGGSRDAEVGWAVDDLPLIERRVVLLHFDLDRLEGPLTFDQIADRLQMPKTSVYRIWTRAKAKLRESLQK